MSFSTKCMATLGHTLNRV